MSLVRPGERLFIVKGVAEWRTCAHAGYPRAGWMTARSSSDSLAARRARSFA